VGGLCNGVGYKGNGPVVGLVRRAAWSRRACGHGRPRASVRGLRLSLKSHLYISRASRWAPLSSGALYIAARFCGNRLIPWARMATPARPPSGSAAGQPVTAREGVLHLHAWTLVVVRVQVRCRAHRHPRIRDHRAPNPGPRLWLSDSDVSPRAQPWSSKLTPLQSPSGDMMEYAMAPYRQLSARFTSGATAPSARCEARQRRELCTGGSGRRRRRRRRL
jgi:hypothetical protein